MQLVLNSFDLKYYTKSNAVYSIGISEPECKAVRIYKNGNMTNVYLTH